MNEQISGNRQTDDERRPPAAQKDHHHEHHEDKGVHDRLRQRPDRVGDLLRTLVDQLDVDVARQRGGDRRQTPLHLVHDVDGIGARLFLDDYAHAQLAVHALVHRRLFERIADLGHVVQQHLAAVAVRKHHLAQLRRGVGELAVCLDIEGVVADIDRTARDVDVLGGDDAADLLDRQPVGFDLLGIDIDLHLAFGNAHDRHRSHAVDAVEVVDQLVVENLVQRRIALIGRDGEHHDRNHRRRELEYRRVIHVVGQQRLRAAHGIADVIGRLRQIGAVLEFERNHREVVRRLRSHLLEVLHRVEVVLQHTGDIGLDIGRIGPRIGRNDGDLRDLDIGILIDGEVVQRK